MSRYELADFEWRVIERLLSHKPRGALRVDDRHTLNGILWALRSGAPWRNLPERYAQRTICHNRFNRCRRAGIWDRLIDAISAAHDGAIQTIDSTFVREHQQAATAERGGRSLSWSIMRRPRDQESRCRPRQGPPIRLGLTARQTHDGQFADELLDRLRPRTIVLADKSCDADRVRELIQEHGATPNIPPKRNRKWKLTSASGSAASAT